MAVEYDTQVSFPAVWVCDRALGNLFLFPAPSSP